MPERVTAKMRQAVFENLALICQGCNNHKYDKIAGLDPESQELTSLYGPRQQIWAEHFAWSSDFQRMLGLTPMGRATIATLNLNRDRVVNLRQVLRITGDHSP